MRRIFNIETLTYFIINNNVVDIVDMAQNTKCFLLSLQIIVETKCKEILPQLFMFTLTF